MTHIYTAPSDIPEGILVDKHILRLCRDFNMIVPYETSSIKKINDKPCISYGLSSIGYDVRLSNEFKVIKSEKYDSQYLNMIRPLIIGYLNNNTTYDNTEGNYGIDKNGFLIIESKNVGHISDFIIDPKNINAKFYETKIIPDNLPLVILPGEFVLGTTLEMFNIPINIAAEVHQKSTLARSGLNMMTTIVNPGQTGQIVIELFNATSIPIMIYPNEGIALFVFKKLSETPNVPYNLNGTYMGQTGVTLPKTGE